MLGGCSRSFGLTNWYAYWSRGLYIWYARGIGSMVLFKGGYKDGLQPESLADGNWLVKQKQPVSKIETKSVTNLRSLYES
jgi:hypothetical protein